MATVIPSFVPLPTIYEGVATLSPNEIRKPSQSIDALDLASLKRHPEIMNQAMARYAGAHVLNILNSVALDAAQDIAQLSDEAKDVFDALKHYIPTGKLPEKAHYPANSIMENLITDLNTDQDVWFDPPECPEPSFELATVSHLMEEVILDLELNEQEVWSDAQELPSQQVSRLKKVLEFCLSNSHIAVRSVLAVGVPTFIRQGTAFLIQLGLDKGGASLAVRNGLGIIGGGVPLALAAIGFGVDNCRGVATTTSNFSRGFFILSNVAGLVTIYSTGAPPALSATLAAYSIVYCGGRELVQAYYGLEHNAGEVSDVVRPSISAIPLQIGIGAAMTAFASPSGAGAVENGNSVWPYGMDANRAMMNTAGEGIMDGIVLQSSYSANHQSSTGELRIRSQLTMVDQQRAVDILLRAVATRGSFITNLIVGPALLIQLSNELELGISPAVIDIVASALLYGLQIPMYVGAFSQNAPQPRQPLPHDVELGMVQTRM